MKKIDFLPVAPMRGRGFGRPGMTGGRHDPFRSRPPNTSRPPSMHVDDFVKMESQHNQQQVCYTTLKVWLYLKFLW